MKPDSASKASELKTTSSSSRVQSNFPLTSPSSSSVSTTRRRSLPKENDRASSSPKSRELVGTKTSEQFSLQETLRALAPESGENEIYWLPVAVARLGMKTPNAPHVGFNIQQRIAESEGGNEGKIDHRRAIFTTWHHAAKTEDKLYDLQMKRSDVPIDDTDVVDASNKTEEPKAFADFEDDEDLQELLDDLKVAGYSRHFKRTKDRRSKRYTSALEQEIAERNEQLRKRMEQMNTRAKRFEKGFEALDSLAVRMDTLAETSKLRVQFLEQCLIPLYNESARHQICKTNAERAIEAIDTALLHYKVPEQFSAVIHAGPVKNLPAYCTALERVKASVDFFSDFHSTAPEYEQVNLLFRTGRENLIKEFRDLLSMHSKPVPPVLIQDAIVNSLRDPSVSHELAHFAESAHNDLKLVAQWFLKTNDQFDFMEVYANFRSQTMTRSLEQFRIFYKEQVVSNEGGGISGGDVDGDRKSLNVSMGRGDALSGHSGETASRAGIDEDLRSVSMAPDEIYKTSTLKRRAVKSTPRKKAQTAGTASLFQKLRKLKTSGTSKKSAGVRVGIDDETYQMVEIYMALISAFLKLVESEVSLMFGIIPNVHMRDVFDRIIKTAMASFDKTGKDLKFKILHHVNNGDFSAVLLLLQILEHFQDLQPLFDSALEGCTLQTQQGWRDIQMIFRSAVISTMDGFLSTIKQSTDKVLPPDGTVHEITSNTIAFLSNLVDFRPLFDALSDEKRNSANDAAAGPFLKQGTQISRNFPQYLNSVITHLLANLTTRAENYGDQILKSIFLLNNTSYMFNYLKQAGIIDVMKEDNPTIDKSISARINDQKKAYFDCWNTLTRLLTEAIGEAGPLRPPNDLSMKHSTIDYNVQLKEKDRQAIKDRCTAINKELEVQVAKQEKYSVPDSNLRMSLQEYNRNNVVSLYNTYRERYIHIPFTKFHDKYLPYTSQQVAEMFSRFFSQDTFSAALHVPSHTFRIDL